jgi:hypothetical protein
MSATEIFPADMSNSTDPGTVAPRPKFDTSIATPGAPARLLRQLGII